MYIGVQNSKRVRVKKEESINKRSPDNNVLIKNLICSDVWFFSLLVGRGKNCFWLRLSALTFITAKTHQMPASGSSSELLSQDLVKMTVYNQQSISRWQSDQHWVDSADLRGFWDHKPSSGPHLTFVIDWWHVFWALWKFGKLTPLHVYRGPKLEKG